jgi:hypothetical protein
MKRAAKPALERSGQPAEGLIPQRIAISIDGILPAFVEALLVDFFNREVSPAKPVYITRYFRKIRIGNGVREMRTHKIELREINPDPEIYSDLLANIAVQPYPHSSELFIWPLTDDSRIWQSIQKITKQIIAKMLEKGFVISEVDPPYLNPKTSLPLWEQIPDRRGDREMLRLWHAGHTNVEIAGRLSMQPRSVTTRISELRRAHGTKIVPLNTQRRRNLLKTDDTH